LPALGGIALARCATVEEALGALGLSLDEVRGERASTSDVEREIAQLEFVQVEDYGAARWREHALHARICASHPGVSASKATTASAFAALFHLHAGDERDARALVATIAEGAIAELPPLGRVWVRIIQATSQIDAGQHSEAAALAEQAVELARPLSAGERRDVLGRALGTLGRAKMHAGADEAALPWLREAAQHHEAELPRELARSLITLASGLRRAGRHDEALEALDRTARSIEANASERESAASWRFMQYERGRVLFEQGRHDEAYPCFERVMLDQPGEEDYPRAASMAAR
jgi:tetratricopeptide (TPR) repeat protein